MVLSSAYENLGILLFETAAHMDFYHFWEIKQWNANLSNLKLTEFVYFVLESDFNSGGPQNLAAAKCPVHLREVYARTMTPSAGHQ